MANEQKCSSLDAKQAGELLGVRFDSQELAEFWGQSKREPIGREVN